MTVSLSGAGGTGLGGAVTSGVADSAATNFTNGWEVVVDIPTGTNYQVTQFHLNQAIKNAINNDTVLSKLLTAADGPAGTLTITSKIDGAFNSTDLSMTISTPTLTAGEEATALAALKTFAQDSSLTTGAAQTANNTSVTTLNAIAGMSTAGGGLGSILAGSTVAVKEVFTATFGATIDADSVTFDGVGAIALGAGATAIANAGTYTTAYNLIGGATWVAVNNGDGTVTFTQKTGDRKSVV